MEAEKSQLIGLVNMNMKIAILSMSFPDGSVGKESTCNAGDTRDTGSIPGLGRHPGEGNGQNFHTSILAWKIPWTEEPCGLQPKRSQRVRDN